MVKHRALSARNTSTYAIFLLRTSSTGGSVGGTLSHQRDVGRRSHKAQTGTRVCCHAIEASGMSSDDGWSESGRGRENLGLEK